MALAEDQATGDLWIATMGGLNRFSAGRLDTFTQLSSGLVNDVVYGVTVHDGEVWAATAAGTSRYEIAKDRWTIFDESNTPMHEIWCYSVTSCADVIYLAVWGGGLLEYRRERNRATSWPHQSASRLGRWKDYRDPDGEMEIDLFRNDGLVHDVVASVACEDALPIWIGTYFGLSTYDGRRWKNFMEHDSPLISNFINFVDTKASLGWIATDNGLNATDRRDWWTYRRDEKTGRGEVLWTPQGGAVERFTTDTIFPHNYILGISFQDDEIWLATEKGAARGTYSTRQAGLTGRQGVRSASVRPVRSRSSAGKPAIPVGEMSAWEP